MHSTAVIVDFTFRHRQLSSLSDASSDVTGDQQKHAFTLKKIMDFSEF